MASPLGGSPLWLRRGDRGLAAAALALVLIVPGAARAAELFFDPPTPEFQSAPDPTLASDQTAPDADDASVVSFLQQEASKDLPLTFGVTIRNQSRQMGARVETVDDGSFAACSFTAAGNDLVSLPSQLRNVAIRRSEILALGSDSDFLYLFTDIAGVWHTDNSTPVFADPNLSNENEAGIPETTSISVMGMAAIGLLVRWRRRTIG